MANKNSIITEEVKEAAKATAEAAKTTAKKATEAAKTTAKKATESAMTTAKKATESAKKATEAAEDKVKKTVKKTVKKVVDKKNELVAEVYVQFAGREAKTEDIIAKATQAYVEDGHRASSIKTLQVYLKPEEAAAYYVINHKYAGRVELF